MPHGIQNVLPLDPVGDALRAWRRQIPDVLVAGLADQRRSLLVRLRNRIGIQQIKGSALNHVDLLVRLVQQHIRYGEAVGDIGKVAQNDLVAAAGAQQVQVHMRPDKALGLVAGPVGQFLIPGSGQHLHQFLIQFRQVLLRDYRRCVGSIQIQIFLFAETGKARHRRRVKQRRNGATVLAVEDDVAGHARNQFFQLCQGIFHLYAPLAVLFRFLFLQDLLQRVKQKIRIDRFRNMRIHADLHAFLHGIGKGIRRHGDDGH